MIFERRKLVRFQHCDPAAIVFYPQYVLLFHEMLEDWFSEGLAVDYGRYIRVERLGVPAVRTACEFLAPSHIGESLALRLRGTRLGRSSLDYEVEAWCEGELRARSATTVVQMSLETRRSVPWRGDLRQRIAAYVEAPAAAR